MDAPYFSWLLLHAGHGTVNHSAEEYVRGTFWYTNTVESYFALLKRCVYGMFHNLSEAHLYRYLAEFDFRHNTRKLSDAERGDALLCGAKGKQLLYKQSSQASNANAESKNLSALAKPKRWSRWLMFRQSAAR